MRFMVIVKGNKDSEAGVLPDERILTQMGKFNEELVKAGVMLDTAGLTPYADDLKAAAAAALGGGLPGTGERLAARTRPRHREPGWHAPRA